MEEIDGVSGSSAELPKYPHNALEGYANGCLLDMRVRFAMELLTHSPIYGRGTIATVAAKTSQAFPGLAGYEGVAEAPALPHLLARHALDLATALLQLGAERGLVDALPADDGELSPSLRAQARRTASYQALQQKEAQAFLQREADQVVPQAASQLFPRGGRH